ncbi:hypothetical protein [Flavobacterium beibuense]|uniref:hypothetical protein n=1 Tax=Flavobacterium beibuense TaxID=657326 RepID=UPI003A952DDF
MGEESKLMLIIDSRMSGFQVYGPKGFLIGSLCVIFETAPESYEILKEAIEYYEKNKDAVEAKRAQRDTSLDNLLNEFGIKKPK